MPPTPSSVIALFEDFFFLIGGDKRPLLGWIRWGGGNPTLLLSWKYEEEDGSIDERLRDKVLTLNFGIERRVVRARLDYLKRWKSTQEVGAVVTCQ